MAAAPILVKPREIAEAMRPEPGSVCISITDRHRSDARLQPGWHDVLRLKFDDIECEGGHYLPLSSAQADAILDFVFRNRECDVVVHCEWGHSRSVGVGVFLSAWLDRPLCANLDQPNSWVIAKLCLRGIRRALRWRNWRLFVVSMIGPLRQARKNLVSPPAANSPYAQPQP